MRSQWCCMPTCGFRFRCGQDANLRRDCEYERRGTANVFCGVQPKAGGALYQGDSGSLFVGFCDYLLGIAEQCPEADTIHLLMDNLSDMATAIHTS